MNTVLTLSDLILIKKKKRGVRVTGVDTGGKGGKREEGLEVSGRVNGGEEH
jgi:hypothetical protein